MTNINKAHKLPKEYDQTMKWILMQMVTLMPSNP